MFGNILRPFYDFFATKLTDSSRNLGKYSISISHIVYTLSCSQELWHKCFRELYFMNIPTSNMYLIRTLTFPIYRTDL